jgi:hypothetical protein
MEVVAFIVFVISVKSFSAFEYHAGFEPYVWNSSAASCKIQLIVIICKIWKQI